eukprot:727820-Amphidinium_carterae.2
MATAADYGCESSELVRSRTDEAAAAVAEAQDVQRQARSQTTEAQLRVEQLELDLGPSIWNFSDRVGLLFQQRVCNQTLVPMPSEGSSQRRFPPKLKK